MVTTHATIKVGNTYEPMNLHDAAMTSEQLAVIEKIAKQADFDFSCMHFSGARRRNTFNWMYYTKDDKLNLKKITPTGRITDTYSI